MPKSGTANYSVTVGGALAAVTGGNYLLTGNSTGTFSADFAANTVSTSITIAGTPQPVVSGAPVTSFGTYTGTGTVSSNAITGTLTGTNATGGFSGAFFGPQALELGVSYYLNNTGSTPFNAVGGIVGIKQ
ncbi:MAG: transferrin-binding protein-like solute binding protein [Novosphingobium sp.]